MDYTANYQRWTEALKGTEYEQQLAAMAGDEALIQDSFYKYLEFGTAGMRGTLAPGTNRNTLVDLPANVNICNGTALAFQHVLPA